MATPSATDRSPASPADLGLSGKQVAVLALLMHGKSNKAICRALDLAEPTVKYHITTIFKALKVATLRAFYEPLLRRNPRRFEIYFKGLRISGLPEGESR